jgi:hypothetical protein
VGLYRDGHTLMSPRRRTFRAKVPPGVSKVLTRETYPWDEVGTPPPPYPNHQGVWTRTLLTKSGLEPDSIFKAGGMRNIWFELDADQSSLLYARVT